jgi:hypothetical protein
MGDSVKCVSDHAEDLEFTDPDGGAYARSLSVGEIADDVDLSNDHNKRLLKEERIIKVDPDAPPPKLAGAALAARAEQLEIEGRTTMTADELRDAVEKAEAEKGENQS